MNEAIEQLLVLQKRDRSIAEWREEITGLELKRAQVKTTSADAEAAHANAEQTAKELEVRKESIENEIVGMEEKIRTYSKQQLETKDNTTYKTLVKQVEDSKKVISDFETDEIMALEAIDEHAKVLAKTQAALDEANAEKAAALKEVDDREAGLTQRIEEMTGLRAEAAGKIDSTVLGRYERLLQRKGTNIVVGIQHGACGGCHMKLPASDVIAIRSRPEIAYCPNCSRILYYTRDMVLETD
jgi:predicted  nucleic acid-binding Zn-ribbon protein